MFEIVSAAEMAFSVKKVLNRGVITDELSQTSRLSEAKHCPVSSPKRQVRFHRPVVQPVAGFLSFGNAGDLHRRAVDRNLSVTMMTGWPYRFIDFFVNFNAAFPSRRLVTQRSRTSPSWSTARHRWCVSSLIFTKTTSRCHCQFDWACIQLT